MAVAAVTWSGMPSAAKSARVAIRHDRVDLGIGGDRGEMLGRQVGRAQHDAAGNAVHLDQRQGGGELVAGREQHRAAGKLAQLAAEARAAAEIREGDAAVRRPQKYRPAAC